MKRLTLVFLAGVLTGAILLAVATRGPDGTALQAANSGAGFPASESRSSEPGPLSPGAIPDSSIGALAAEDLLTVLDRIRAIESPALRQRAVWDAAAVWAAGNPTDALDAIRAIPDTQEREELLGAALSTFSDEAVVAMFRYIASVDDWDLSQPGLQGLDNVRFGYSIGGDVDFRELGALVDDLPPPLDRRVQIGVIQGLARQDPAAAMDFFETLPADDQREAGYSMVNAWAESDPRAAFEWARASADQRVAERALDRMAWSDPLGALDLALQMEETAYLLGVANAAMEAAVRSDVIAPESFAAALVALPESARRDQAIEEMIEIWTGSDAEQVLEWLLAKGQTDSPALFRDVAANLGDPDLAASYADRIPSTARSEWIQTTADMFSSRDPTGAAEWIEQFRDEPAYATSVSIIANAMARYDGPGAVELLHRASLESDPSAVSQVASRWASRDMRAAIDWVQTLTNNGVRRTVLGAVARRWESTRPDDAERWVLTLPNDEERDAILYPMISTAFTRETEPSESLLRAYSNDYARQVAAANAAREMENYNEPAARRLLDRYVTDQELRRLFESGEVLPLPN